MMKQNTHFKLLLLAMLALSAASFASAGAGQKQGAHGHDGAHAEVADVAANVAPNGGRIIRLVQPHLEFWLTPERFVQITFIDHNGAVVPVADQAVSLIGGDRSAPTMLSFEKNDGVLRSTAALPEIKNMPIVLQIKVTPEAKMVRAKFYLNLGNCGSCSFKEYACICGHSD